MLFTKRDRRALREILRRSRLQTQQERQNMATLDDLEAEVDANTDVVASAVLLLDTIHQELQDALDTGDPAKIQEALDKLSASKDSLAAAVARNTDAAAEPAPEPTPEPGTGGVTENPVNDGST